MVDDGHVQFLWKAGWANINFLFSLSIILVTNYSERYMYLEAEKNSGVELDDGPVFPQTGMSPRV